MSRRRWAYIAVALALLVGARLFGSAARRPQGALATTPPVPEGGPAPPPEREPPLLRPPSAIVELLVLTARPEPTIRPAIDREELATSLGPAWCGDPKACAACGGLLRDEHATDLRVGPASDWDIDRVDVDAGSESLTAAERASVKKLSTVISLRVTSATESRHLGVRAAFAAAGAIAERVGGLVYDPLLGRIENAGAFRAHAVTEPLDASSFRRDRIALLWERAGPGLVRILTAGLSRWGVPDVEAKPVGTPTAGRVAEIVLGVGQALADQGPLRRISLSRDALARARGAAFEDADLPPSSDVLISLRSDNPQIGDPNGFIAHIVPPTTAGALGYLELAERFFGPERAAAPEPAVLESQRRAAQRDLAGALSRAATSAHLRVRLPFAIPGDKGTESMWVSVTRYDARTVTGTLDDDPLAATDVARGDEVTRKRTDVEEIDVGGLEDAAPPK